MDTKDQLVGSIRDWIQVDNDMKKIQLKLKTLRQQKKKITIGLVEVMKNNEIDCFDINDGSLIYAKTKVKKPINKSTLLQALKIYFDNNLEKAEQISKFILEQREEKVNESIRHKISKQ